MGVLLPLSIILLLVFINGVFVAAEFSFIGVRRSRMEQLAEEGNQTAQLVSDVIDHPARLDRYIATAQLGVTLASLGLGMYGEPSIAHHIDYALHHWLGLELSIVNTVGFLVGLSLVTYLHVVLGEMIPKSLALQNTERSVFLLVRPITFVQTIFSPVVTALNAIGVGVLHLLRMPAPDKISRLHTPDELELIVSESVVGGMLEEQEQQLVTRIFDFSERRVSELMVPRPRIDAVPVDISEQDLIERVLASGHTRFPVYENDLDHILGILHLKDLVRQQLDAAPFDLYALLHDAPRVPENLYAEALLSTLKRMHVHMAIVIDEYQGTAGLVTLEDLIEEVVGEVRDEFDLNEESDLTVVEPGHITAQGTTRLYELEPHLDIHKHGHDVETVGGLVLAELNRVPEVGDEVRLDGITFTVEVVDGLMIKRLSIRYPIDSPHAGGTAP
ncbi:MAG TPA: hemolysin family protein [Aggregatilinea sp.]|uniref:hemolysin family protein n=1 Tax=Aggregatilinea sp. TaxID=2806333 RepID=UPI002C968C40|nr:hemolysin family protein [Aggregatilinea sp.]HML20721.1 hemolysin family protein [Aggregatilinea sp.]